MKFDNEGFLYPKKDVLKCNNCGLCEKICPALRNCHIGYENILFPIAYAVKNKNNESLKNSASGGAFVVFAEKILQQGGVVFGAAYDKDMVVKHIAIENAENIYKLQSSKYVQSDVGNTYSQVKQFLKEGRKVLYSGTPCQIAGLNAFLGIPSLTENLITIDLICHGVPSPKLFEEYISFLGKKNAGKVVQYNFRSKQKIGWQGTLMVKVKVKVKHILAMLDPYFKAFLENRILRECCYSCKYASKNRVGDITIGDYWGIEKVHPEFNSKNGASCCLLNTEKGLNIFSAAKNKMNILDTTFEKIAASQPNLSKPSFRPKERNHIFPIKNYFWEITFLEKVTYRIKIYLKKIMRFYAFLRYDFKRIHFNRQIQKCK